MNMVVPSRILQPNDGKHARGGARVAAALVCLMLSGQAQSAQIAEQQVAEALGDVLSDRWLQTELPDAVGQPPDAPDPSPTRLRRSPWTSAARPAFSTC